MIISLTNCESQSFSISLVALIFHAKLICLQHNNLHLEFWQLKIYHDDYDWNEIMNHLQEDRVLQKLKKNEC